MNPNDPRRAANQPPAPEHSSDDPAAIFQYEPSRKPWFVSIINNLKELAAQHKQAPLEVTARPLSKEELRSTMSLADLERTALPWYRTVFQGLKESLFPPKLPPLELTSRPVPVAELLQRDKYAGGSRMLSVAIHVAVVAAAFLMGTSKTVQNKVTTVAHIFMPPLEEYTPKLKASNGGGGGGDNSPTPAGAGHLPKSALKQFTPPTELLNNMHPRLAMEPTIIAPPDAVVPTSPLPNIGDPSSHFAFLSNGPGSNGGIGDGDRGGVGNKKGRGYGPGDGDAGIFVAGRSGVSFPQVIFKPEPEYSEEARKAKYQGTVTLTIIVDKDGNATDIHVSRPLGMGLDEKAIDAVKRWRFKPGYKDGKPVPVLANVQMSFRLL